MPTLRNSEAYNHWLGRVLEENRCLGETSSPENRNRGKRYLPPGQDKICLLAKCERREKVWGRILDSKNMRLAESLSQEDCSC